MELRMCIQGGILLRHFERHYTLTTTTLLSLYVPISHTSPMQVLYSANSQSDQATVIIHKYYTFRTTQWSDTYRQHHVCCLCQVLNNLTEKCLNFLSLCWLQAAGRTEVSSWSPRILMLNAHASAAQQQNAA